MRCRFIFITLIYIIAGFSSCENKQKTKQAPVSGDTLQLSYAKGFTLVQYKDSLEVTVYNPWDKGKIFARYAISDKAPALNNMQNQRFATIKQSAGVFSSTVVGYLKLLGLKHLITGINEGELLYDSELYSKYQSGSIKNLGQNMVDNYEAIIDLSPEALFKSGFEHSPSQDEKYLKANLPVVYINDWTESHPLARAEWIKLVGSFFGRYQEADSIFKQIASRYILASQQAEAFNNKPSVMAGGEYKGTWYVPGGQSYFAQLLKDAKADYSWAQDSSVGSIAVSLETVVEKNLDDQYWFTTHDLNAEDLTQLDKRYQLFKSVQDEQLYTYNKLVGKGGGNDYWETGSCRPDIILSDLIEILHKKADPDSLQYYNRLTNE